MAVLLYCCGGCLGPSATASPDPLSLSARCLDSAVPGRTGIPRRLGRAGRFCLTGRQRTCYAGDLSAGEKNLSPPSPARRGGRKSAALRVRLPLPSLGRGLGGGVPLLLSAVWVVRNRPDTRSLQGIPSQGRQGP